MSGLSGILSTILVLCLVFHANVSGATTYTVGDQYGWDIVINVEAWPQGKTFYVGDILVFNYDYRVSDVRVVNKEAHDTCTVNEGAELYESGHDSIPLKFGANYFMSSNSEDCQSGLKLAINATARPPPVVARHRRMVTN